MINLETITPNKDFSIQLASAKSHEKYLSFFVESHKEYNESKGSNYKEWLIDFLEEENFDKLWKFHRFPLESADIIQDSILPQLERVFASNNRVLNVRLDTSDKTQSAKDYLSEQGLDNWFRGELWNRYIFQHNSILVGDLRSENESVIRLVSIQDVHSIGMSSDNVIDWLIWEEKTPQVIDGVNYSSIVYKFTKDTFEAYATNNATEALMPIALEAHDFGRFPGSFISRESFNSDNWVCRKHKQFSNKLSKLEMFTMLHASFNYLLPHGGYPISTFYKQNNTGCGTNFDGGHHCKDGYLAWSSTTEQHKKDSFLFRSEKDKKGTVIQKKQKCPLCNTKKVIQVGREVGFPVPTHGDDDKFFDMNANFLKFTGIDIDQVKGLDEINSSLRQALIDGIVGTGGQSRALSSQAMNGDQVNQIVSNLENNLTTISKDLSTTRTEVNEILLGLRFSRKSVINADYDYGDQFYLQSETDLLEIRDKANNAIDYRSTQFRIIENRFKNNPKRADREKLLFDLLPYNSIKDGDLTEFINAIPADDLEIRINFNKYIDQFEDIVNMPIEVWAEVANENNQEAIKQINLTIKQLIKDESNRNEEPVD